MAKTFAEAMAEVQNRANMHRKEIHAEAWGGELAPGGRGIIVDEKPLPSSELEAQIAEVHAQRNQSVKDMTKENWDETIPVTDIATVDHINKVEEAKKDIQVNKSTNLLDQWKKNNIPQSGALNVPIPTMKEPPLVKEEEMDNDKEQIDELSDFGQAFAKAKEGSTFMYRGKPIKRITAKPGAGAPSTGNVVSQQKQPSSISPAPSGISQKKTFNSAPNPSTGVKPTGGATVDKNAAWGGKKPNYVINRSGDAGNVSDGGRTVSLNPAPAPKPSTDNVVSKSPTPAPSVFGRDPGAAENRKRVSGTLNNSYDNPMIAAFMKLQETPGNMFEAAKKKTGQAKKYSEGDKDEIRDDPDQGAVASSTGTALGESLQRAARVSMFDPSQGYSRTAGSADGAASLKERIAAAWNSLSTGYPATHPETGAVDDAVAADMAAIKEEVELDELYGKGKLDGILRGIEAQQNVLNRKAKRAEYLYAASQKNDSHKGADSEKKYYMSQAKTFRKEETEVQESKSGTSELARLAAAAISRGHPVKKLPDGKAEGWADNRRPGAIASHDGSLNDGKGYKKRPRLKTEEAEMTEGKKEDELSKLASAAIAKGHKITKLPAGKAEGWADNRRPGAIASRDGSINDGKGMRKRARFRTEGVEFSDEELAHIQSVMENNPEGNAIAGRDPNTKQGDSDKSTVGGIANESKKK